MPKKTRWSDSASRVHISEVSSIQTRYHLRFDQRTATAKTRASGLESADEGLGTVN